MLCFSLSDCNVKLLFNIFLDYHNDIFNGEEIVFIITLLLLHLKIFRLENLSLFSFIY